MAKQTIQEQIVEVLVSMAEFYRGDSGSSKFQMVYRDVTPVVRYWVGKAGALRRGRTISESISLARGKKALEMVQRWKEDAAKRELDRAVQEEFRRQLAELDANEVPYRRVRSERQSWGRISVARQMMLKKHALAMCVTSDAVMFAMPEPLYTRYIRAQHCEAQRRKQTQFVALILATNKHGAGSWARGALLDALGGSEDAVNALYLAHDEIGDGSLLASVPEWCSFVNPWSKWASQSECVNAAGDVVALIVMCGPTMHV